MSLRRGILLGFLAGAIGVVMNRRAASEAHAPYGSLAALLHDARHAARAETEATRDRLHRRLEWARRTGRLPDDPS